MEWAGRSNSGAIPILKRIWNGAWPIALLALAIAVALAILDGSGLIDVVGALEATALRNPTVAQVVDTYQRGEAASAQLASDEKALAAARAQLTAEEKRLDQQRADVAAQKQALAQAKATFASEQAEFVRRRDGRAASDAQQRAERAQVIAMYAAMDPNKAAAILSRLDDGTVETILDGLSPRQTASILARFDPGRAARLTKAMDGSVRSK